eukprot:EG_transcript_9648
MDVYNTKNKAVRRVRIVPNDRWGGAGLLGCCIMWENIETAYVCTWHILDVMPQSNAERAGIQPHRDYIIGMQAVGAPDEFCTMFTDEQDFEQRLSQFLSAAEDPQSPRFRNYSVVFLVFDTVENSIREILSDIPLGCEVGGGYMHTIPSSKGDQRLPTIANFRASSKGLGQAYNAGSAYPQVPTNSGPFMNPVQESGGLYGAPPPQPTQLGALFTQQTAKLRPQSPASQQPLTAAPPAPIPHRVPNPYAPTPTLGGFGIGQVTIQLQE